MAANKPFANLDKLSKLTTPTPKPFDFVPTQGSEKVRIGFSDNISLDKRTNQPSVGSTTALAQYYLSDQNVGIIKIKKQQAVQHKSDIQINKSAESMDQGSVLLPPYNSIPEQGTVEIKSLNIDSLLRQGTFVSNETYTSFVVNQDAKSVDVVKAAQGTFTSNQITYSVVQTTKAVDPESINQGSIGINRILPDVNQGFASITQAVDTPFIERNQGIRKFNQKVTSDIEPVAPTKDIEIRVPYKTLFKPKKETPALVPASIIVVNAKPANAFIDGRNPPIQTLGYLADSFGAQLFPSLRHGSEDPQNRGFTTKQGVTPHAIVDTESRLVNDILLQEDPFFMDILDPGGSNKIPNGVTGNKGGFVPKGAGSTNTSGTERTARVVKVLSGALNANQTVTAMQALASEDEGLREYSTYDNARSDVEDASYFTVQYVQGIDGLSTNPNIIYGKALKVDDTEELAGFLYNNVDIDSQKGKTYQKEKSSWTSARKYREITKYADIVNVAKEKEINPTGLSIKEKVVKIKSLAGGGTVTFTAFLTSFSDSHNASWTDVEHVGQMDVFKVYKGATRQISLGFKVVSGYTGEFRNSSIDVANAIEKLNALVNTAIVGVVDGNYVKGPVVELSVVGLVNSIVCAISSVKIDTELSETGWDADAGTPHIYSVSIDAAALATKGGSLLSNTATYLG